MTTLSASRARYPGAAAIAVLVFLVIAFAIAVIDGVVSVVYTQGQTLKSLDGFDYALPALGFAIPYALWQLVPMAVGVFASFWLVLPLRPEHRVGSTILRAVVAVLIGLIIAIAVEAVRITGSNLPVSPQNGDAVDNRYYILVFGSLAHDAWLLFADTFALIVASGLAMWGWLRTGLDRNGPNRNGPARYELGRNGNGADRAGDGALPEHAGADVDHRGLPG